jgi:hypothetical protein
MLRFSFCAGLILFLASQAHAESEFYASKQAETLGFAIECGCLKYDEETVVRSLRYLFPAVRGQDRQTLVDSVRKGRRKAIGHEEIFPACLMICNAIDWGPIHRTIRRSEVVTMLY